MQFSKNKNMINRCTNYPYLGVGGRQVCLLWDMDMETKTINMGCVGLSVREA